MFVHKAAVVGGGTMGGQIAQAIANSDTPVVKQTFSGMGRQEVVHSETRPTPTTTQAT